MSSAREGYLRTIVVVSVIIVGLEYNLNASSFAILVGSIAEEMLPIDMQPDQIGWLVSMAAFTMIPGVLISAVLTPRMKMRNILIFSWLLYGVAGAVIYWCQSTAGILAMRAIQGLALGIGQPSSRALPARLYGQESRGNVLGLLGMAGGIMSMVVTFIYGRVALIDWRLCMFVALGISLIAIIFAFIWVPNLPPEKKSEEEYVPKEDRRPFGLTFWAMLVLGFFSFAIGSVIQIESSIQVSELGLGGTDVVSYVNIACTVGIILAGIPFGKLFDKLGKWMVPISALGAAIFTFWFANAQSVIGLCAAGFLANIFTIGTLFVYTVTRLTYAVPKERSTVAVTVLMMAWFLGQTLTTPWINWTQSIWGATASVALNATAVAWAIILIVSLIYIFATRKMKLTALEKYGRE